MLEPIKVLASRSEVRISDYGYDELAADGILAREVVAGLASAEVLEDYPDFPKGPCVTTRHYTKLVHEGEYVAEVDVELIEADTGWSPYLSLDDAFRLDDVREALRRRDIRSASRQARLFTLTPVAV